MIVICARESLQHGIGDDAVIDYLDVDEKSKENLTGKVENPIIEFFLVRQTSFLQF